MPRRRHHHIRRSRPSRLRAILDQFRRGFAMPMVLLLLVVSGMTIVVIMQRQTSQTHLVEEMLAEYETHHAAFGVRSIVRKWLINKRGRDLAEYAAKDGVSYRFILPDEVYVSIWIKDSQGLPTTAPTDIGAAHLPYYREVLSRIQKTHDGELRSRGSAMISMASAPDYVLRALVADEEQGARLADRVVTARERRGFDRDELMDQLRRSGLADDEIARVVGISTFDPVLWRVNVLAEDRKHRSERRFVMQAEIFAGSISVRSWEEMIGTDPEDPFAENPPKTNPEIDDTADQSDNNPADEDADQDNASENRDQKHSR
ncbi:MAG: hypothetical protein H6813_04695 [Phycisphaeraceae bacterium]|nr:hypothetical protein [Phycisphaeraceae bacterium]MCB9847248.1 hypothetical protein [Phycisphaeraceae bacterium]